MIDHHGMTETGPVSYGCPKRQGVLHVIESAYIAEVIDPESGRAVCAGRHGRAGADEPGADGLAAIALSDQ